MNLSVDGRLGRVEEGHLPLLTWPGRVWGLGFGVWGLGFRV